MPFQPSFIDIEGYWAERIVEANMRNQYGNRRDWETQAIANTEYLNGLTKKESVMSEEKTVVLISRTEVNKVNWNKLKLIANILTQKTDKEITRESLTDLAIDSTVKYYEKELGI
jgi:hypothetical protein